MNELVAQLLRSSVHRFIGRLGADPEVRYFESGTCVANTNIAINKPGAKKDDGQKPDWLRIEVWGEQAQAFADALHKGSLVDVTGRVKTNSWTDRNTGETKTQLVVTAEQWAPVGQQQPPAAKPAAAAPAAAKPVSWESSAADSDDIPF